MPTENYKNEMLELIKQNVDNQEQQAVENQNEIVENTSNDKNQEIETSQEEETENTKAGDSLANTKSSTPIFKKPAPSAKDALLMEKLRDKNGANNPKKY